MITVAAYLAYLALAVPLIVWVAGTLSRNGRVFLADVFAGNEELAQAVNTLLVVGFYLLNLGFVALYLRVGHEIASLRELIEVLSVKLGIVMLVLGVVHFCNVLVFSSIRRRTRHDALRSAHSSQLPPAGWAPSQGAPYPGPAPS